MKNAQELPETWSMASITCKEAREEAAIALAHTYTHFHTHTHTLINEKYISNVIIYALYNPFLTN